MKDHLINNNQLIEFVIRNLSKGGLIMVIFITIIVISHIIMKHIPLCV
jgi:hypothetical protein